MDYAALAIVLDDNLSKMRVKPGKKRTPELTQRGEMFTLGVIVSVGDAISPGELSDECGVSSARIAMTLKSLENKGFIDRETDKNDRRRTLVTPTDKGLAFYKEHDDERRRMLERILRELGDEDAENYVRLVGLVADIMDRFRPPA